MKLIKLVEITRIRQAVREPDVAFETTHITSSEDVFFIQDDGREIFLVILLNTKNRVIAVHREHQLSTHVKILSQPSSTVPRRSSSAISILAETRSHTLENIEVLVIEEVVIEEVVKLLSVYICTSFIFERIILCTFLFGFYAVFTNTT